MVTGLRRESKVPYVYCVESLELDLSVLGLSIRLKNKRMGIDDHFIHELGSQSFVREAESINASAIVNLVKSL